MNDRLPIILTRPAMALALTASLLLGQAHALQQEHSPELQASFKKINQESVTSTISYLASDEMAGRDTPSPELTLASEFVAKRFQAAGLKGLGDEGSFFQKTEIATVTVPQTGIRITCDDQPVKSLGMISAGPNPFSYQGEVEFLEKDHPTDAEFDGPVCISVEKFSGRRDPGNFSRRLARLRQKGATAILVQVDADHSLVARAASSSRPRMAQTRGGAAGFVALIGKTNSGGKFSIELPKQTGGKDTVQNVIGVIRGSDPELSKEAIIFTAHLDHIGTQGTVGDTICNGADDDATGVTAVLTLADAYAALKTPPKRSIIFMTFWGEEKGLLGSRYYCNNPVWPLEKTVANINIEMIGRPEAGANEKCWVTGWHNSDLGKLMNEGAQSVGILIFEHPKFSEMLYRASDNYSFVQKGVIAHSFSAGSLHEDYHQPSDEWEKLELKHMTRVIEGLFAGSLPIANAAVTPAKIGKK